MGRKGNTFSTEKNDRAMKNRCLCTKKLSQKKGVDEMLRNNRRGKKKSF